MNDNTIELRLKILINNFSNKNYLQTITLAKQLLKDAPKHEAYLYNTIGLSYKALDKLDDAEKNFVKVITEYPGNVAAKNNYAMILTARQKTDEAEKMLEKALQQQPNYLSAINNLANIKKQTKKYKEAISLYERAIQIKGDLPIIHYNLAVCLISIRDHDKALQHAYIINDIDPSFTFADKLINEFTDYSKDEKKHLDVLEKKLSIKDLGYENKVALYFSLGKAYEDKKKYDLSFKYYKLGNTIKRNNINYDFVEENKLFDCIKRLFKDEKFKGALEDETVFSKKKIIFICGMPRSGTTLTEQIISSHREIRSLGETDYVLQLIEDNFNLNNLDQFKNQISEILKIDPLKIFQKYLDFLPEVDLKKNCLTDKSLFNFQTIGLIKIFFPNSKIIVLKRNFENNLLSIFKNDLASKKLGWTYNEEEIKLFHNLFLKYIEFWKSLKKDILMEVEYEKLASEPRLITEKILKFCDLDWDENCLEYYSVNKSAIDTASANQANKPIYKNSINKFENYRKFFKDQKKTP
jgi:tetratricopeptide (TPR) repeat protein